MMASGARLVLAFDGGGTSTRAGLYDERGTLLRERQGDASNPVLCGLDRSIAVLTALGTELLAGETAAYVAAGISGAGGALHRDRIARQLCRRLGSQRAVVTTDIHALLYANARTAPAVVVIAGTGSSVIAQSESGELLLVGGRGHLMGDDGSAYAVVIDALRRCANRLDEEGTLPPLAQALTDEAGLSSFQDFVPWTHASSKQRIANLARAVTSQARHGDVEASAVLLDGSMRLARLAGAAMTRLHLPDSTPIYLAGGLFEGDASSKARFARGLSLLGRHAVSVLAPLRGHQAAAALATAESLPAQFPLSVSTDNTSDEPECPPTEQRAAGEPPLDRLSGAGIARKMAQDHQRVLDAIGPCIDRIGATIELIASAFRQGGRLVYVGAGTSGRLGVLDASECPPTFGAPHGQVIALIAGGETAVRESVEGAEDNTEAAKNDLDAIEPPLSECDVVVGITASGTTPYVRAALDLAAARGARTAMLFCNPGIDSGAGILIPLDTGPELLAGSTRLKAGTATKIVLNMLSTGAMALSGRVFENYMIGVRPINAKLKRRAIRIVADLAGLEPAAAEARLIEAGGDVAAAVLAERLHVGPLRAKDLLSQCGGDLRAALERGGPPA